MKNSIYCKITFTLTFSFFLLTTQDVIAARLKRVLILDFVNIESNPSVNYLEKSITESIYKMLKRRFAFKSISREIWKKVARANYLFKRDYWTESVSMNIGLLTKQDIVISGGYRIINRGDRSYIVTNVQILDIGKRRLLKKFNMEGPAGSEVFDSIEKLTARIEVESRSVLPNKNEWQKLGYWNWEDVEIFRDFIFGVRAGGFYYHRGWADNFKTEQPVLGISMKTYLPLIWEKMAAQFQLNFLKHSLEEDVNKSAAQSADIRGVTSNYFLGLFFIADIALDDLLLLMPKIGGGYVIQNTVITGEINENLNNYFPYGGAGLEISFKINNRISFVIDLQCFLEIENRIYTYLPQALLGLNIKF